MVNCYSVFQYGIEYNRPLFSIVQFLPLPKGVNGIVTFIASGMIFGKISVFPNVFCVIRFLICRPYHHHHHHHHHESVRPKGRSFTASVGT